MNHIRRDLFRHRNASSDLAHRNLPGSNPHREPCRHLLRSANKALENYRQSACSCHSPFDVYVGRYLVNVSGVDVRCPGLSVEVYVCTMEFFPECSCQMIHPFRFVWRRDKSTIIIHPPFSFYRSSFPLFGSPVLTPLSALNSSENIHDTSPIASCCAP